MTTKEAKANKDIRDINKELDKEEKTKNENSKVKNFFAHKIAKIIYAVAAILFIIWATLTVRQAIQDYNQHYIDKGIQLEKERTATIDKEVAARSKQAQ